MTENIRNHPKEAAMVFAVSVLAAILATKITNIAIEIADGSIAARKVAA